MEKSKIVSELDLLTRKRNKEKLPNPVMHPRTPKIRPSDSIVAVPVNCPECGAHFVRHVPILVESKVAYERDELDRIIHNPCGEPTPKIRYSYVYDLIPLLHPAYDMEQEEQYRILMERGLEEKRPKK